MKSSKMISRFKTLKMLIISRENAGFPVMGQFLTPKNSFFVHGEPPPKLDVVTNLFNCILMPEMVLNFSQLIKNDFGKTPYLSNDCLLDSEVRDGTWILAIDRHMSGLTAQQIGTPV